MRSEPFEESSNRHALNSAVNSSIDSSSAPLPKAMRDRPHSWIESLALVAVVVVSLVLLASGLLKVSSKAPGLDFSRAITNRDWIIFGISIGEIVLGIWLLSGLNAYRSTTVAIFFFCGTTLYGAWMLFRGQETCPCFGDIQTSTLFSLALSLTCLSGLVIFRRYSRYAGSLRNRSIAVWVLAVVGSALCVVAILSLISYGRARIGIERVFSGNLVTVQLAANPIEADFFEKTDLMVPLRITNHSVSRTIQVVGWSNSCGAECEIAGVPAQVPPASDVTLMVRVSRPRIPEQELAPQVRRYLAMRVRPYDVTKPVPVSIDVFTTDGAGPMQRNSAFITLVPTEKFLSRFESIKRAIEKEGN